MNKKLSKRLLCGLFLLGITHIQSQTDPPIDCNLSTNRAKELLVGSEFIVKNETLALNSLNKCASENYAEAQYILGMLYKNGLGVAQNDTKAFDYIKKAALQDHPKAACELGVFYKDGIGCQLNFDSAIQWFTKAEALGNSKGSYSIGYLYFKGLGSIEQDYNKAVTWFQQSSYPMAKHWLGICHYFGYGVSKNTTLAMELLLSNPFATNSGILAQHLTNNSNIEYLENKGDGNTQISNFDTQKINSIISAEVPYETSINNVTSTSLKGEWKGQLIELDWSGKKINRRTPIGIDFSKNKESLGLNYKVNVNKTSSENKGTFLEESFFFNNLVVKLPRLYQDNLEKYDLDYQILSANTIEIKEIDSVQYLIANIDTQVLDWKEPGPPMLLVLANTKSDTANNEHSISEEILEALASSKGNDFISLYPNPFKKDLLIQYDLLLDSMTRVEIYPIDASFTKVVAEAEQKKGKHIHKVDGSNFKNGLYVVKVTANGNIYTKLIIKE